jgi:acetoacetyl-CoA synthetase
MVLKNPVLWQPDSKQINQSRMAELAKELGHSSYQTLHQWSVSNFKDFWKLCLDHCEIIYDGSKDIVFEASPKKTFYGGSWFPNITLNYAENLLSKLSETPLIHHSENREAKIYKKEDILDAVRKIQSYLVDKGIKKGDFVAALAPNNADTLFCMLAATSLGAIWSSCSPEFGVRGILDRFEQIKPKILFLSDSYFYNGKKIDLNEKNEAILKEFPDLIDHLILSTDPRSSYQQYLNSDSSHEMEFARLSFMHPLYVLFSSGTTGAPKCIVHSSGGSLLQHAKEHRLHCDLKAHENLFYFTTTGWMMWNWMISGLQTGATIHTYDGSPIKDNGWSIWDIVEKYNIEVFGTSAKFIGNFRIQNSKLSNKLKNIRLLLSTGSPLLPEDFDYIYEQNPSGHSLQVSSICGGTDIVSCFMLGNPLMPVCRGEIQAPGLGMDVHAVNDQGTSVLEEKGELVCTQVFPAMPIGFLHDSENKKYEAAYFTKFPQMWHHGDYITHYNHGGITVHGRSDATLNPGGVRIGTSEIYRIVETHPSVKDSLVVGKTIEGDEKIILFIVLKDKEPLNESVEKDIKSKLRSEASPRHIPYKIFQIQEIPYTMSGKKVELAVKQILAKEEPKNIEALSNPHCLEEYRKIKI